MNLIGDIILHPNTGTALMCMGLRMIFNLSWHETGGCFCLIGGAWMLNVALIRGPHERD